MPPSERLVALLQALRNRRRPTTAAELASEFGVSERTVYRDLAALVRWGAAIEGAAGLGYVLRTDGFLPPLMLDGDEADAVVLGLRFVTRAVMRCWPRQRAPLWESLPRCFRTIWSAARA
jgi:predicted DNA-binding transcriptional regulator YafY